MLAYQVKTNGVWTGGVMPSPVGGLNTGWVRSPAPPPINPGQFAVFCGDGWAIVSAEPPPAPEIIGSTSRAIRGYIVSVKDFGAVANGINNDTAAIQAAIDSGASHVELMDGVHLFSSITVRPTLLELVGKGATAVGTYLKRAPGSSGAAFKWDGSNRVIKAFFGHFRLDCCGAENETYGLDLSGFSYCTFQNIWVRLAKLDGIYTDGSVIPTNKQFSNNTFINVTSNNNLRDGFRFAGSSEANSANTYIGCEGSGNSGIGFNEIVGYSNQTVGCTFQGNGVRDLYTNGSRNTHSFYAEGSSKSIELGAASVANNFSCRSSYPIWNTFVGKVDQNTVSVRGEVEPERHIFDNPYFMNWVSVAPTNTAAIGAIGLASHMDTGSPANAGVTLTVGASLEGLAFVLEEPPAVLNGKWVTLLIELDTSGVVDPIETRVVTRDGSTPNNLNGEFAVELLPISASGAYLRLAYDVKFPLAMSSVPSLVWYVAYSGVSVGGNVVKLRSARIVMGQTRNVSQYVGVEVQHSTTSATLSIATNGVNTHRKYAGRLAYDTTSGRLRYATGSSATAPWRATDGSGDVTPS